MSLEPSRLGRSAHEGHGLDARAVGTLAARRHAAVRQHEATPRPLGIERQARDDDAGAVGLTKRFYRLTYP